MAEKYFIVNLHESKGLGQYRTRDPGPATRLVGLL